MYFSSISHLWPGCFLLPSTGSLIPPPALPLTQSVTLSKLHTTSLNLGVRVRVRIVTPPQLPTKACSEIQKRQKQLVWAWTAVSPAVFLQGWGHIFVHPVHPTPSTLPGT